MKIGVSLPVREMAGDIEAIKEFAIAAEELGYTHLRVPDQVMRLDNKYLHEPITLLAFIAAVTKKIELVPSVVILPIRQTLVFARQAAQIEILSKSRLRIGVGVGSNREEYQFSNVAFETRGKKCEEQIKVLRQLWSQNTVEFDGRWHSISNAGINPLPINKHIPIWIGAGAKLKKQIINRIALLSDGWFVLASPDDFLQINDKIQETAEGAGRVFAEIGTEAGVAVVGPREKEWEFRVQQWKSIGLSHVCLRTLGGNLSNSQHLKKLEEVSSVVF